jgi:UDP-2-acetamido-2-deoxy-ribo-hexuluronate aminotransferase
MTRRLRAAVVGLGKFGNYHASKYNALANVDLVAVVDLSSKTRAEAAQRYGCQEFLHISDLFGKVDLVSITTPATTHAVIAIPLIKRGIHVYIEKPIATTLSDAERIIDAANKAGVTLQIGHQERTVLSRLQLDINEIPKSIECHRLNPWTGRASDVDVALDLMIHDIDLALQLATGHVNIHSSSGSGHPLNDEVMTTLSIGNACSVKLHAGRRAETAKRTMKLEYSNGTVFIDFLAGKIEDTRPVTLRVNFSDLLDGADKVQYDPLGFAIAQFVECAITGAKPFITGEDGLRALAVTLDVLSSINQVESQLTQTQQSKMKIPLFDLQTQADRYRSDVERRIARVLDHKQFIDGPEVRELESKLASYTRSKHCLSVSSGTMALQIALMGENINSHDAIFVPAFTYNATCNAVLLAGAQPVFVDVEKDTCNISPRTLRDAIQRVLKQGNLRPAIVIAVDLYGAPCEDLSGIAKQNNMLILADAAQSLGGHQNGMPVGNLADMTATSFYPSKTLGGFSDGGALFTNDSERFERWKSIRWHGTDPQKRESVVVGLNGRLGSLQCAALLSKLEHFEEEMENRRQVATCYLKKLSGVVRCLDKASSVNEHAWGLFTILLESKQKRQYLMELLRLQGISTGIYYSVPLHKHQAFRDYLLPTQEMKNSEWLADRVLSLPMGPYMGESEVSFVCTVLKEALLSINHPKL